MGSGSTTTAPARVALSRPVNTTTAGGIPIGGTSVLGPLPAGWTDASVNSSNVIVVTTTPLAPGESVSFTVTYTNVTPESDAEATVFSATIQSGAGGDTNTLNNNSSLTLYQYP